jgi:hypothetical protein
MRLKTVFLMVGFSALSALSSSAMAQLWAKNCVTNMCLDGTTAQVNGRVQVSECVEYKLAQQWHQNSPWEKGLQNAYEGFGNPCLDMNAESAVATNTCANSLQAQKWTFADNGQVGPIQNGYWNNGKQCAVVGDNNTVIAAKCDGSRAQDWYWVNVGDKASCPENPESRMKLPTMKLPTP